MSYTRSFCDGIIKAKEKKWVKGNIIELGDNSYYPPQVEPYLKSIDPSIVTCKSAQQLWTHAGGKSYIVHSEGELPPLQYDVVINQGWLEEKFDVCEVLRQTHKLTKVGGFVFTNVPIGLAVTKHSFTVNFWQQFCEKNDYEIRFCQVSDENANWPVLIPMGSPYTFTKLRDVLYKFRETWTLRITIVMQKKNDNELIFD